MTLRSGGGGGGGGERKLSFEILRTVDTATLLDSSSSIRRSNSAPVHQNGLVLLPDEKSTRRKRKHKKKKPAAPNPLSADPIAEEDRLENPQSLDDEIRESSSLRNDDDVVVLEDRFSNGISNSLNDKVRESSSNGDDDVVFEERLSNENSETYDEKVRVSLLETMCEVGVAATVVVEESRSEVRSGELRQRSVGGVMDEVKVKVKVNEDDVRRVGESSVKEEEVNVKRIEQANGKLETTESLDWKRLMADDPNYPLLLEKSPVKYFMEEMSSGNSLRSTTALGNEKERERVYDTIFRLPWRCELLIDVGFYVCMNSFLSLFTIMPVRVLMTLWRALFTRQAKKLSSAELSDLSCLFVLACGVLLLGRTDISLIYHMIRGQGTIKLYVVYNVLEIFDKLCQNFGGDVLETLFSSAEGLVSCSRESLRYWVRRYSLDLVLAAAASIVHSFVLLAQAITLSTCIVAHNNALMALLVSNNFAEIKSNVFKRFSKDNVHSIVYADSVERFHISAFLLFVLAQNLLEAEGAWFENFLSNALLVYICEMAIDVIKHSFIAKFNDIKPITYSEFLEDLCKQTLNMQTDGGKRILTFVPLAPACVVIRVLTPVYAAHLPCSPLHWKWFWTSVLAVLTFVMLASLKVMIGMGLQKHATWYIKRCRKRKLHSD